MIDPNYLTGKEPHPLIPCLSEEELGRFKVDEREKYLEMRKAALFLEGHDPLRHGFEPSVWKLMDEQIAELRAAFPVGVIELLVLGGNRAGKTRKAAHDLVQAMLKRPEARVWGLQSVEAVSRSDQQTFCFDYIPPEWRPASGRLKAGRNTKIVYTRAGGFSENTFVLPNSSQCWFKFYGASVKTLESAELDFAWADELITPDWLEAIRFRLLNRNGILLVTFTPVEGYSSTVKEYLDGARSVSECDAELLPIKSADGNVIRFEQVPRILQCVNPKARVIFFHTADNPYGNYPGMKVELAQSNRERILMRAYGVPSKKALAQFPMFNDRVHIIPANRWEQIAKEPMTRYHFVDPCSGRNWFMIWVGIDILGRAYIYREWPSYGHREAYVPGIGEMGEWAVPGRAADGERGPAQQELGWGLLSYKAEIERLEDREEIFERWIDARYANTRTIAAEQPVTLIEELAEIGMEFLAAPSQQRVESEKANNSLRLINDALFYDKEKPISRTNQPKLYVVETCPNTIFSLKEWTNKDQQKGANKDPIDCIREMILSGVGYCDEKMLKPRNPWAATHKPR
jgi:hypothetical protein